MTLYNDRCERKGRACLEKKAAPLTNCNFLMQRESRTLGCFRRADMRSQWQPMALCGSPQTLRVFRKRPTFWELVLLFLPRALSQVHRIRSLQLLRHRLHCFLSLPQSRSVRPRGPHQHSSQQMHSYSSVERKMHSYFSSSVSGSNWVWAGTCVYLNKSSRCPTSLSPSGQSFSDDTTWWLLSENLLFF